MKGCVISNSFLADGLKHLPPTKKCARKRTHDLIAAVAGSEAFNGKKLVIKLFFF